MNNAPTGFRSASTLSTVAIIMLAGMCLCDLLTGIFGIAEIADSTRVISFGGQSRSPWLIGQGFVALIQSPLYIATVVFFLVWLFRIYKNLDLLESKYREFTAGWAVGWWFIPFANLVKPFQVMREAWCESDPVVDSEATFLSSSSHSAPTYMGLWWGFWIGSNIINNIVGNVVNPSSIQDVSTIGVLFLMVGVISIVPGVLCIKLVRDITSRQQQRSANIINMQRYSPPPPPTFASDMA